MRFADLFAGLGGFHLALKDLGHECVFASEIDRDLQSTYFDNFDVIPRGDIRLVGLGEIPQHEILCAGFPCQPFSKAGDQRGLDHPEWGNLFGWVLRILDHHRPRFFILENVPNLGRHNKGHTWASMEAQLRALGYQVDNHLLSPHRFGIPQIRERLFIVGELGVNGLERFEWPVQTLGTPEPSLKSVLDIRPPDARRLTRQARRCLDVWQDFLRRLPGDAKLPSFPIWSMEFGATYPYEEASPWALGPEKLRRYRGPHGRQLDDLPLDKVLKALPSYARTEQSSFPRWKITFIKQNREFYQEHRSWIDEWMQDILEFPPSLQKFEWNCQGGVRDIWQYVIQFRASGVRVKRPTTAPSLVASTTTQVPVIAWEGRYMTVRECARLQGMDKLTHFPRTPTKAFGALGNAVNVDLVKWIANSLLSVEYVIDAEPEAEFENTAAS
jgi:DNA (cytosine-5)-methyltransferase 1